MTHRNNYLDGCPCENYDCYNHPSKENDKSILVVYKWDGRQPIMVDRSGNRHPIPHFSVEYGTGAYGSCSALLNGRMLLFGGEHSYISTQIAAVESCRLRRIGTLPMTFIHGACNTFSMGLLGERVLLCFGHPGMQDCHRFMVYLVITGVVGFV